VFLDVGRVRASALRREADSRHLVLRVTDRLGLRFSANRQEPPLEVLDRDAPRDRDRAIVRGVLDGALDAWSSAIRNSPPGTRALTDLGAASSVKSKSLAASRASIAVLAQ
jgi:hypothetical protein